MDIYKLDHDEAIILQAGTVMRDGYDESQYEDEELNELVLTNKNLIYVILDVDTEKETAVKVPLDSIKVIGGKVQAKEMNHEVYGRCLQVQFKHGIEYWRFGRKSKMLIPQWVDALKTAVDENVTSNASSSEDYKSDSTDLFRGCKDRTYGTMVETPDVPIEYTHTHDYTTDFDEPSYKHGAECTPEEPLPLKKRYCASCGASMNPDSKFCPECGYPTQINTVSTGDKRKTVYEGEMHKCPSCGEIVNSFEAHCPACGHEFRGKQLSGSVREFAAKLEKIESEREVDQRGILAKTFDAANISNTDKKKINLIRSFSVPNTKEDIYEFLILASSNINLEPMDISEKAVSDAWAAKFEQVYQKASIIFADTYDFARIQGIYDAKVAAKAKKNRQAFCVLGICMSILIFIFIIACVFLFV